MHGNFRKSEGIYWVYKETKSYLQQNHWVRVLVMQLLGKSKLKSLLKILARWCHWLWPSLTCQIIRTKIFIYSPYQFNSKHFFSSYNRVVSRTRNIYVQSTKGEEGSFHGSWSNMYMHVNWIHIEEAIFLMCSALVAAFRGEIA